MIYAGIDAGSRAIKTVLVNSDGSKVIASGLKDQGVRQETLARELFEATLKKSDLSERDVAGIVATGYGRNLVGFADSKITEISCHAAGVRHLLPDTATIIEIGGQDSKVVRLSGSGMVRDFNMNDRCAAGTGRFLEVVAARLDVQLQDLGRMAETSERPAAISSMCVVFAETEIVGLLASGMKVPDLVAGVQASVASRVSAMAGRKVSDPVVFTGGVALIPGMKAALESALGREVRVAPDPQFTGALGAALLAARSRKKK